MMDRSESQACGCDEAYEHLLDYLDSSLADGAAERIRAHIADCELCSSDLSTSEIVRRLLRRCCVEQAPAGLRERIITQVEVLIEADVLPADVQKGPSRIR